MVVDVAVMIVRLSHLDFAHHVLSVSFADEAHVDGFLRMDWGAGLMVQVALKLPVDFGEVGGDAD